MVGSAGRNPASALASIGRFGRWRKYRAGVGSYVGNVFRDDHTGNLEEPEVFCS